MRRTVITKKLNPEGKAPRGQILLIFASMLVVLLTVTALAVDLGWLWTNALRVQRAADAAALAGVVHLPGDVPGAYSTAIGEAKKNGYIDGSGGTNVTPVKDAALPRRLDVTVQAPVKTFFLGLIGMPTVTITRIAQADYVLPVPMGSPQNYYGVGDFRKVAAGATSNTGTIAPTGSDPSGTQWTNPSNAYASGGGVATVVGQNQTHIFKNFNFSVPAGNSILGIEVKFGSKSTATKCQVGIELSDDGGSTWTTQQKTAADVDGTLKTYTLGSSVDLWGGTWTQTSFTNANFRLRVQSLDPGTNCASTDTWSLDFVNVNVFSQAPAADAIQEVSGPSGPLCSPVPPRSSCSQGFWGAVFTKGGVRQNGDRYAPANWSGGSSAANPDYDANGYNYTVEVGPGGEVWLFDATFCATGSTAFGGWYGAGDHWTSRPNPPGGPGYGPVTTRYRLYDTRGTDYSLTDDVLVPGADSGSLFANKFQSDQSGMFGSAIQRGAADGAANCASDPYHNGWYRIASGMAAGKYRLNVYTSDPANDTVAAENLFSIYTNSAGKPRVYGGGRMAAYTNLEAGRQTFYLAQIGAEHAGKTMDITLFDPGDVQGPAFLRILSPDGNAYNYATFSYAADAQCTGSSDACSASGRTQIQTNNGGSSAFDNSVLVISIPLPSTYGDTGLTPAGETEAGWWKIEYEVAGGNDTTTWEVSIRGNPVRLVVP